FARPSSNNIVDIYDTLTHNWQTVNGMEATGYYLASSKAAVVNNKVIFSAPEWNNGSPPVKQIVNIYDAVSNSWSVNHFPQSRGFYAMTTVGNKVIYAGGEGQDSTITKKIDIYNASNNSWSVVNFNEGRRGMVAASVGNKVVFAGGFITRYDSLVQVCDDFGSNCDSVPALVDVDRVDIWDVSTNTWTVAHLSEARTSIVTAVVGNKIIFAGGGKNDGGTNSSRIDVYDAVNNSWSSYTLPPSSWFGPCLAYTVGNKVLICHWISDRIDIYDAISNSWSVVHMSEPLIGEQHQFGQVAVTGNKIVFFVQ
ncbi:MAG: kelch repeat-containing protein, partial [Bacteroidota bacterium]